MRRHSLFSLFPCAFAVGLLSVACGGGGGDTPAPIPSPPVIGEFTANPSTIIKGGNSTLSWSVAGATSFNIDSGVGPVSGTSLVVSPTATSTYTLTATNTTGTVTANARVTVLPAGSLSVFAGVPSGAGNVDGVGPSARFNFPYGAVTDRTGNLFVADAANYTIRKMTPEGLVSTIAGVHGQRGDVDGTGPFAQFWSPKGMAIDSIGNLYLTDGSAIRTISPAGKVATLAGNSNNVGSTNGQGPSARFFDPKGIAVDTNGNVYVADDANSTIRKITPTGMVSTFAGSAQEVGSVDGTGSAARFRNPKGVAVDGGGIVYVTDTNNRAIRKITPEGAVSTLAGAVGQVGSSDGNGTNARFMNPNSAAVDSNGNLFITDTQAIRKITPAGVVSTLAGSIDQSGNTDGPGFSARFSFPSGLAVGATGDLYVADSYNNTLRKVAPTLLVSTVAGNAILERGSTDGPGSTARFGGPQGIAVDQSGNAYLADTSNSTIRKITPAGVVSTFAGSPTGVGSTDAVGTAALFNKPFCVAVDGSGNVYVTDYFNSTIRKISSEGVVTTLAGTAGQSGSLDGPGTSARFTYPWGVAVDGSGNVYVAERNCTIRKITSAGMVSTLAGVAGQIGSADGVGSNARFGEPNGLAIDGSGNLYVVDNYNHTIRKITPGGVVSTLAGSPGQRGSADGTGAQARFAGPVAVSVDASGKVYVADAGNSTIRMILPDGLVNTIVGSAGEAINTPGRLPSRMASPSGVAVDPSSGNLFIAIPNALLKVVFD